MLQRRSPRSAPAFVAQEHHGGIVAGSPHRDAEARLQAGSPRTESGTAATAYLSGLDGVTLNLLVGTPVLGLASEGGRRVGVRLASRLVVRPESEVLLCVGAIDSPRLLTLSGLVPRRVEGLGASSTGHKRTVLFSRSFILR